MDYDVYVYCDQIWLRFWITMARLPKNPRTHCYFGCEEGGPLHHFPKPDRDRERFNAWTEVLDDDIKIKGDAYIYNQLRLCNKHFEDYYISPSKCLTRNAVPTLYITGLLSGTTSSSEVAEVSVEPAASVIMSDDTNSNMKQTFLEDISIHEPSTSQAKTFLSKDINQINVQPSTSRTNPLRKRRTTGPSTFNQATKLIEKLQTRIKKLTARYKTQYKKIQIVKKMVETKAFTKIMDRLPDPIQTFMKMQIQHNRKPKGRKFNLEQKILAASLLKHSPKCYTFLRKLMVLPSKRTLQRLLSSVNIKPGLNDKIIRHLEKAVAKLPLEKRLFALLFDEIALSPGLYFNQNKITGFQDLGFKKSSNIADHALVLMLKGIKTKKKQPILYHFCKGGTKALDLKKVLLDTIAKLNKAGIIIVATICDQATPNVSTIKQLQTETRVKYIKENKDYKSNAFEACNTKIFPLFDTPHLLKGVRNNFITKNIKYRQDDKVKIAKWDHLRMLLSEDKGKDEIRIINKLTEYHVDPNKIPKMKVKYAAQVFSQRVSAVMKFLAKRKILPAECEDTADLLLIFDKLFDSFNGHSYRDTAKILKGCLKNNSPHFQFWTEIKPILNSIEFEKIRKNQDGSQSIKYEKVPSVQNWIHNINTFIEMWQYLNTKFEVNNLITRNFNQDPLENFFCCIRSNGVRNINPTCMQFINAYKTLLINNLNSVHSINANCEEDDYRPLKSMKLLIMEKSDDLDTPDFACEVDSLISTMNQIISSDSILHAEAKKYVAGYIVKKSKSKIFKNCTRCMTDLLQPEIDPDSFNYMIDYTKKSLFNACDSFIKLLNDIYFMIVTCMRESPEIDHLREKIVFFINCRCDFSIIHCEKHKLILTDYIINLSINLIVNSWCTGVNRILIGKFADFDHNDKVKLQAFNYYKTHKNRK